MKHPIFVTSNLNKVKHLSDTLGVALEHRSLELDELQSTDPHTVAEHKVRQAYDLLRVPVLIEDTSSGFTALDGLPGPYMKSFLDMTDPLEKMCRMLDGFNDRSAYAIAVFAYYDGEQLTFIEGRIDGTIADHPRGEAGYGWDPIFMPHGYDGKTSAELDPDDYAQVFDAVRDTAALRAFLLSD